MSVFELVARRLFYRTGREESSMEGGASWAAVTTAGLRRSSMLGVLLPLAIALTTVSVRADELIAPDQIIDATTGDWNKDGHTDLAILATANEPAMMVGVYIYLRDPEGGLLKSVLALPDKIWGRSHESGLFGQEPSIRALDNGSIAITEQNYAIGRERWEATRTLAYRDGTFVVAGFTFDSYDTLQEYASLHCDLNFLSGKGTINGAAVTFKRRWPTLEEWKDEVGSNPGLSICREK